MYKEELITNKQRAALCAKAGFLFWRDHAGAVRLADTAKVKTGWGIWDFFTCSHREPKGFVK